MMVATCTPEQSKENLQQVLNTFERYHELIESSSILNEISKEDTKNYFKIANFVECVVINFKQRNMLDPFLYILKTWLENKKHIIYDISFYTLACDNLLAKYFKRKGMSPTIIDTAIRMYTAFHPKERLENAFYSLVVDCASSKFLLDHFINNLKETDKVELESEALLCAWLKEYERGQTEELTTKLESMLTAHKVDSSLPIVITALSLDKADDLKKLILSVLVRKMNGRNILNKNLWLQLFKKIKKHDIAKVAINYNEFATELCNFINHISKIDKNYSVYSEINEDELQEMINCLSDASEHLKTLIEQTCNCNFVNKDDVPYL